MEGAGLCSREDCGLIGEVEAVAAKVGNGMMMRFVLFHNQISTSLPLPYRPPAQNSIPVCFLSQPNPRDWARG